MNLKELRQNIDKLDDEIVKLINQRCKLAVKVGEWKVQNDIPFYVPEREKELFVRLAEKNTGPITDKALNYIYREIISASIALEKPLKIAFLDSPHFPATEQIARNVFGNSAQYNRKSSIPSLFDLLNRKYFDYIVIPIYDKNACFLGEIFADIPDNAKICTEIKGNDDSSGCIFLIFGDQEPEPCSYDRTILVAATGNKKNITSFADKHNINILNLEKFISNNKEKIFIEIAGHINNDDSIYKFFNDLLKKIKVQNLGSFTVLN